MNDPIVGTKISHYKILSQLGEGGMGLVYLAQDQVLERRVALKVMRPETLGDEARRARFLQEARSAAALHHPNIATIFEANQIEDGSLFIAMEHVEGRTLRSLLATPLPFATALDLGVQIAEGLSHAHTNHVVHRDLKPENVLVTEAGQAKILDFGLAKIARPQDGGTLIMGGASLAGSATQVVAGSGLTVQGQIMGTPAYMSPEQARGQETDFRSDIFSFGSMLYEMCAGQPSFQGPTPLDTLSAVLHAEPKPVSHTFRGISGSLDRVIARCLKKDAAQRYSSTADLVRELRAVPSRGGGRLPRLPRPSRNFMLVAGVTAVAAFAGALLTPRLLHRNTAMQTANMINADGSTSNSILVADFEGSTNNPGLAAAMRELVSASLSQSSIVTPFTRAQLQRGLKDAKLPDSTRVTGDVARQLAIRGGASVYVEGRFDQLGSSYSIILRLVNAESRSEIITLSDVAKGDGEVMGALEKISEELREKLGEKREAMRATGRLRTTITGSFDAYRMYVDGLDLQLKRQYAASNRLLHASLALDPEFAGAQRLMGLNYTNLGFLDSARTVFDAALSHPDRMSESQRLELQITIAQVVRNDLPEALVLSNALLQKKIPHGSTFFNNRATIQFGLGQYEEAAASFEQAVQKSAFGVSDLLRLNQFKTLLQIGSDAAAAAIVDSLSGTTRAVAALELAVWRSQWPRAESLATAMQTSDMDATKRFQADVVLASLQARRGEVESASHDLQVLASSAPNPFWASEVEMARLQLGICSGVLPPPASFDSKDTSTGTLIVRGIAAAARGDTTRAGEMLRKIRAQPEADQRRYAVDTQLLAAWQAAAARKWDGAATAVAPAMQHGPGPWFTGRIPLRWLAGDAWQQANNDTAAVHAFQLVVDPRRLHHDAWTWRALAGPFAKARLATLLARSGHAAEAREEARGVLATITRPDARLAPLISEMQKIAAAGAVP